MISTSQSGRLRVLPVVVTLCFSCNMAGAAVTLLGVQYQEDDRSIYTDYQCFWKDSSYPASCGVPLPGANLHVFIKNEGTSAVTLDDVALAGYSLKTVLKQNDLNGHITNSIWFYWDNPPAQILEAGEPAWYKLEPKSLPPGGAGQVIVRLRRVPVAPSLAVTVDTSANVVSTSILVDPGAPALANISFSADLTKVYLYWRRSGGAAPATVRMDGSDVTAITTTVGDASDFAVSVVSLPAALADLSYHVFQGVYSDDATATGGARVWVNPFVYTSWGAFPIPDGNETMARAWLDTCFDRGLNTLEMNSASSGLMDFLGTSAGKAYAESRNYGFIKDDANWGTWGGNPRMWFIDDEPDAEEANLLNNFCGTGYKLPCGSNQAGTMGMHFISVAEGLRGIKNRPTTINMDGTWKPYSYFAYGQLSDCLCIDHYFQPKVRHAYYDTPNTRPLYLKATVVYATALAGTRAAEPNPARQLLYSCQINDDAPVDPWPWAAPECKRVEAYYAMAAGSKGLGYWWFKKAPTASNGLGDNNLQAQDPALWEEIGLIGAETKLLAPYLVTSHPVDLEAVGSTNVWVRALARGTDTFILFVVNDDYWLDQDYHGTPIANASVSIDLPSWMLASPTAFEVGRAGVRSVNTSQNGGKLTLNLGTLNVAKILVVTTDPQLRMALQQRYDGLVWQGICNFAPSVCRENTSPPTFVAHPAPQSSLAGGSATFSIVATGGSRLTYQWQKNGSNLSDAGHYAGCTTPFLKIASIDANDLANYRCLVSNPYGNQASDEAALRILTVNITQHPALQNVCPATDVQFAVSAEGQGALTYQWQKDGADLSNVTDYSGVTTATLTVLQADAGDEGNYRCAVTDSTSTAYSNAAALFVAAAPVMTQQPSSQTVEAGATAVFSVVASGEGALTYQWQKNQQDLANGGHYAGCTTATLTVSSVDASDEANYRCLVSSGCGGTISDEATLSIDVCAPYVTLLNGSFDASTSGWSVASNWMSYSSGTASFSRDTTTFRSSPNAQKIQPPSSGAGAYAGVRQTISCNVGDAVTFVGWAYQNSPNTYETARLGARFDGQTTPPSTWSSVSAKQAWTSLAAAGTVTAADGATVFLDVLRGSTGQYWSSFDDVAVYYAFAPPTPAVSVSGETSLAVDVDPGCNWNNAAARYAISIGGGAYALGTHWLQANGSVGTTIVWQTDAEWGSRTVSGLATGTAYTFKVKAAYSSAYPQATSLGAGADGTPVAGCTPPEPPTGAAASPGAACGGNTVQLSATPGAGGDTVDWFTGGCGMTPVPGGDSPVVAPEAETTYYARTRHAASGCVSATCLPVTVSLSAPVAADFDQDCDVDAADVLALIACASGSTVPHDGTPLCRQADFDADGDVDQDDFGRLQQCYSGPNRPAACAK